MFVCFVWTSLRNALWKIGLRALVGFELYFELVIVTPGSFDEPLNGRVNSHIIGRVKLEALSAFSNDPCFAVTPDDNDVDKFCKLTCIV